jgi:hypothetical protein
MNEVVITETKVDTSRDVLQVLFSVNFIDGISGTDLRIDIDHKKASSMSMNDMSKYIAEVAFKGFYALTDDKGGK